MGRQHVVQRTPGKFAVAGVAARRGTEPTDFTDRIRREVVVQHEAFVRQAFETVDAIVTPVSQSPAFKLGAKTSDPLEMYLSDIYTITASLAGNCGISVPCGETSEGLPVGMQILGDHLAEEKMFRLADAYERRK